MKKPSQLQKAHRRTQSASRQVTHGVRVSLCLPADCARWLCEQPAALPRVALLAAKAHQVDPKPSPPQTQQKHPAPAKKPAPTTVLVPREPQPRQLSTDSTEAEPAPRPAPDAPQGAPMRVSADTAAVLFAASMGIAVPTPVDDAREEEVAPELPPNEPAAEPAAEPSEAPAAAAVAATAADAPAVGDRPDGDRPDPVEESAQSPRDGARAQLGEREAGRVCPDGRRWSRSRSRHRAPRR